MPVGFDVTNQKASPALYASSFATRPAPAFVGRLFVDTDTPSTGIYRDTGTVWLSISGGSSETQSLNDVCVIGNTTTALGILINGQSTVGTHDSSSSSIPPEADFALTIGEDYPATGFSIYTTHKNHFAGVLRNEGTVVFDTLGGTGSRIVVASADGTLTASAALSSYVTGSGTTNYLPKFTGASVIGNSQIFDNGTNVGINTASPTQLLVIKKDQANYTWTRIDNQTNSALAYAGIMLGTFGNSWGMVMGSSLANSNSLDFVLDAGASNAVKMRIFSTGNLAINSTTDAGFKFDCNGTGNFSGSVYSQDVTAYILNQTSNPADTKMWGIQNLNSTGQFRIRALNDAVSNGINAIVISRTGISSLSLDFTGAATFSSSEKIGNFTTAQKNALTASSGMVVYDTTLNKLCVYTTAWETITSI